MKVTTSNKATRGVIFCLTLRGSWGSKVVHRRYDDSLYRSNILALAFVAVVTK